MAKYIIEATRLNEDGSVYSVSNPIEVDSDTINTIKIFDKTYVQEKHGRWIYIRGDENIGLGLYECSECHKGDIHAKDREVPYCWSCGAKMDLDEVEE